MIYIIPMLHTKNIDKHVIPGICKAYEKFAIVYKMDDIMSVTKRMANQVDQLNDSWIRLKPRDNFKNIQEYNVPHGGYRGNKKNKKNKKSIDIHFDSKIDDNMSIEPTYVTANVSITRLVPGSDSIVDTSVPVLIGVKCLPIQITDEEYAIEKLIDDRYAGWLKANLKILYRLSMRKMLSTIYSLKIPFINRSSTASGSIKNDLFFNKSFFHMSNRIVVVADLNDLPDDFLQSPGKINRLFKMHWNALFLADNVGKKMYFTPPEYKGMATVLPYSYLFTLNKQQQEAYKSEDINRIKSSPLFSMKKISLMKLGQLFEAKKMISKKKRILVEEAGDVKVFDRNMLKSFISKYGIKRISTSFVNMRLGIKRKDLNLIKKSLSIFPLVSEESIERYLVRTNGAQITPMVAYAEKVLRNSIPQMPEKFIKPTSLMMVSLSGTKLSGLRELLKKFVTYFRSLFQKSHDHYPSFDELMALTIMAAIGIIILKLLKFLYGIMNFTIFPLYNVVSFLYDDLIGRPWELISNTWNDFKDEDRHWYDTWIHPEDREGILDKIQHFLGIEDGIIMKMFITAIILGYLYVIIINKINQVMTITRNIFGSGNGGSNNGSVITSPYTANPTPRLPY